MILAPFVLLLLMLVISFGRFAQTESLVDQASRDAARAATAQNDQRKVPGIVDKVVNETMDEAPKSCRRSAAAGPPVYNGPAYGLADLAHATDVASITVTVFCDLDLSDLAGLPLKHVLVSRTFTSPLDRYRGYQQ